MTTLRINRASLPRGGAVKIQHKGEAILLADVDGTVCAISSVCPHMGTDLAEGTIADGVVTCRGHGARFELRTGRNVGPAKILFVKMKVRDVRAYPVTISGDEVEIGLD